MSKRIWGVMEYPIIFHELLREGGGMLPADAQRWTYASTRRRWFAFVEAAKADNRLAVYAEGVHWRVIPMTDGEIRIDRIPGATALASEVLTVDRFESGA